MLGSFRFDMWWFFAEYQEKRAGSGIRLRIRTAWRCFIRLDGDRLPKGRPLARPALTLLVIVGDECQAE
jgi:hypothetical protein